MARNPVVGILGARQVGKTTLAREIASIWEGPWTRFDLENPDDLARLAEPMLALRDLEGLVVIDEVQLRPDLYPVLRVLVDRPESKASILVLGGASQDLLRQSSESLAGRIAYHELRPLAVDEVGIESVNRLWLRGGFPRSFLAATTSESNEWRRDFIRTFLERDIPRLGIRIPGPTIQRFWSMVAHYHAQTWNGAELARALGVGQSTVRRYLDLLTGTLVIRQLRPWHENVKKRQVKAPKVYFEDTGLLHTLLGIETWEDLQGHPKVGASWEGFVIREIETRIGARPEEVFYWRTHSGAELDLLVVRGEKRLGFEVKRTTAPRVTKSMRSAKESLGLDRIDVVHAGENTFPLAEGFRAVSMARLDEDVDRL